MSLGTQAGARPCWGLWAEWEGWDLLSMAKGITRVSKDKQSWILDIQWPLPACTLHNRKGFLLARKLCEQASAQPLGSLLHAEACGSSLLWSWSLLSSFHMRSYGHRAPSCLRQLSFPSCCMFWTKLGGLRSNLVFPRLVHLFSGLPSPSAETFSTSHPGLTSRTAICTPSPRLLLLLFYHKGQEFVGSLRKRKPATDVRTINSLVTLQSSQFRYQHWRKDFSVFFTIWSNRGSEFHHKFSCFPCPFRLPCPSPGTSILRTEHFT